MEKALREKILFNLGKAAYEKRDWADAVRVFENLLGEYPTNSNVIKELDRAKIRLNESETGDYDLKRVYNEAYLQNIRYLDIADYVGPVKVVDILGKNRGIVTTRPVKKGELLLADKAYGMAYYKNYDSDDSFSEEEDDSNSDASLPPLVAKIVHNLRKNPETAKSLYALYAGDEFPRDSIPEDLVDVNRIDRICELNAYEILNGDPFHPDKEAHARNGLWSMISFLNHSCVDNSFSTTYGDTMFVYAIRDLAKGEEVTKSYADSWETYKERRTHLKRYGFTCDCHMCELDMNDSNEEQREKLLKQNVLRIFSNMRAEKEGKSKNPQKTLTDVISFVEEMRRTYVNRTDYRTHLIPALSELSEIYKSMGDFEKSTEVLLQVLQVFTEPLNFSINASVYLSIIENYEKIGDISIAKKFAHEAMELYRIKSGVDRELFEYIFPKFVKFLT